MLLQYGGARGHAVDYPGIDALSRGPTAIWSTQVKRRVRDIIPALLFVTFSAGMIAIGVAAFALGDINRLKFGIDSFGNVCGSLNTWNGTQGPDLTTRRHLYLVDPMSAVTLSALRGAKTVCMEACPRIACDDVPCRGAGDNFVYVWRGKNWGPSVVPCRHRCSYYRASPVYNSLEPPPDDWSTAYFPALATTTSANCNRVLVGPQTGAAWQQLSLRVLGTPAAATCGQALQLQSATPSLGPCHPVLLPTHAYAHRSDKTHCSSQIAIHTPGIQVLSGCTAAPATLS